MQKIMAKAQTALWQFGKNREGAALVEYSLLIGLITVGIVALITAVGIWVNGAWTDLTGDLGVTP